MTAWRRSCAVGAAVLLTCAAAVPALAGSSHRTAADNRRAAVLDAGQLLKRVLLPDGARPVSRPDHWHLGLAARPALTLMVDRHTWWKVNRPFSQVLDYVKTHRPRGANLDMSESGGPGPPWEAITFAFPARPGVLGIRWLAVSMIQLRDGSTGVRVDAQVEWIIPRPPTEKVPSGVMLIEVSRRVPGHPPTVARTVSERAHVRRIIQLIDRLPALQPGVWSCPAQTSTAAIVTLTFRSLPGGATLARASAPADSGNFATSCDAMSFSIRGRRQTALVHTRDFFTAVGRLLGVKLTEPTGR